MYRVTPRDASANLKTNMVIHIRQHRGRDTSPSNAGY
jgi:hypothetical protein